MSKILVLEDHTLLRSSMAEALAELPEAEVTAVGTIAGAKSALAANHHDLLVSDLDLPDGSGVELIGEFGAGSRTPVIIISGHLPRYRAALRDFPTVTVREKPLPLRELRRLAAEHLSAAPSSDDAPFGAGEYVQLACMGRHSVRIEVQAGALQGWIAVRRGQLWSAFAGEITGLAALQLLAFADGAVVRCASLPEPRVGPQNLPDGHWEQLLLDAARVHDEAAHAAANSSPIHDDDPLDIEALFSEEELLAGSEAPTALPSFADELERGAEALLCKDYPTALSAYQRAAELRPDDTLVSANVERLTELLRHKTSA